MSKSAYYPADYIDSAGNVFPTVGENIRYGQKANKHFGLNWKTGSIMLREGVLTESEVAGASFNTNDNTIHFSSPISITDFNVAVIEKSPEVAGKAIPVLGIDSAGGCYISGVDAGYKAILFEFEYRELK